MILIAILYLLQKLDNVFIVKLEFASEKTNVPLGVHMLKFDLVFRSTI